MAVETSGWRSKYGYIYIGVQMNGCMSVQKRVGECI